jgi:hypothetical protein
MAKGRLSIGVKAGFLLFVVFIVALVMRSAEGAVSTTRFGIGGGISYTDNVRLAPSGEEESDLLLNVSPSIQWRRVSGRTNTNLFASGDQIVSLTGSGNTQFIPNFRANINHELVKQRLSVTADANVRRTFSIRDDRVSSTGFSDDADISGNVGVGAFYREHLGTLADVNASYRYNRFGTQDDFVSNAGSHSVNLQARSGRVMPRLIWAGYYRANKQEGGNDFNDYDVGFNFAYNLVNNLQWFGTYARFNANANQGDIPGVNNGSRLRTGLAWTPSPRTLLSFGAGPDNWAANANWGYSNIFQFFGHYGQNGRDGFSDFTSGRPFWDARVVWTPSPKTSLDISYYRPEFGFNSEQASWTGGITFSRPRTTFRILGTQTTTTNQQLLQGSGFAIDPVTGQPLVDDNGNLVSDGAPFVSGTDEIFISRCLETRMTRRSRKNTFTLNWGAERRDFQDSNDDEQGYGGSFRWGYRWKPGTTINSQVGYLNTQFDNGGTEDQQWIFRVVVNKQVARRLSVNLEYAYNQRTSTDSDREFTENAILLNFNYGLGSGRTGFADNTLGSAGGFSGGRGGGVARLGDFSCSGGGSRSRGGAVTGGARSAINNTQSNFQ